MTPAQHTRIVLAEFKSLGTPFPLAWGCAMRSLPRRAPEYIEWKRTLNWAKPAYQAFYEGRGFDVRQDDGVSTLLLGEPGEAPSIDLGTLALVG